MARVKKWIYSWELYAKDMKNKVDKWDIINTYHTHEDYQRLRYSYNHTRFATKWVECRKPNPEYKGV